MLITLARKPLTGNVVQNVQAHGCGALNIDHCRIATSDDFSGLQGFASMKLNAQRKGESDEEWKARVKGGPEQQAALEKLKLLGRWPANVLLATSAAEGMDAQSGVQKSGMAVRHRGVDPAQGASLTGMGGKPIGIPDLGYGDTGGASRYFKQIKGEPRC